jgi:hypothetical protein
VEKDLSIGVMVAWQIAAQEAVRSMSRFIEKEHMFIGACSLSKATAQIGVVPGVEQLHMEEKDVEVVLSHFGFDVTSTRRQIRKMFGRGDYQNTSNIMHRSEECKRIFMQAEALSSSNTVSIMHFIAALMEKPGTTIARFLAEKGEVPNNMREFALSIAEPSPEFQHPLPGQVDDLPAGPTEKKKIFIVHGRNLAPALTLIRHLESLGLKAEMFLDTKKTAGNRTIIEILEQIKNEAAFALKKMLINARKSYFKRRESAGQMFAISCKF